MPELGSLVSRVRSKNAGPFWLTIDIFCGGTEAYERVRRGLSTGQVAELLGAAAGEVRRFDIADLAVVKFSLPRPVVQGSRRDRDMHGAQYAWLIAEAEIG